MPTTIQDPVAKVAFPDESSIYLTRKNGEFIWLPENPKDELHRGWAEAATEMSKPPAYEYSPGDGYPGYSLARQIADIFGGEASFFPRKESSFPRPKPGEYGTDGWENPDDGSDGPTGNIFCPTGQGGGIKPDCGGRSGGSGEVQQSPPTTSLGISRAANLYQNSSPEKKREMLGELGISHDGSKPLPTIDDVYKTLTQRATEAVNPVSIPDQLRDSPHEGLRRSIVDKYEQRYEKLDKEHQELNERSYTAPKSERPAIDKRTAEIRKEKESLNAEIHAEIKSELAKFAGREGVGVDSSNLLNPAGYSPPHPSIKQVEGARQFLDKLVQPDERGRPTPKAKIETTYPGERAHYDPQYGGIIVMAPHDSSRTVVHEYGHHLEHRVDGVQGAAKEFLAHRTKNTPDVKLTEKFGDHGYDDHEIGNQNHFKDAFPDGPQSFYVGKKYKSGATEIVSMGLQEVYQNPVRLAKNDPEYFNFMMGLLSGSHRKKSIPVGTVTNELDSYYQGLDNDGRPFTTNEVLRLLAEGLARMTEKPTIHVHTTIPQPSVTVNTAPPNITVNTPPVNVTVETPKVQVDLPAPVVNLTIPLPENPPPSITVEPAQINVYPPSVTVEAPNVTVEAPNVINKITVEPAPISEVTLVQPNPLEIKVKEDTKPKEKTVTIEKNPDGSYTGKVKEDK